ncbi:extracellular solute-binding protein [Roseateles oligotrophus]|uniref:Extracellular solute-binding protein n=1 Tax=Roseateles oligotrophus TaxID=1769250 RepID=A0ABT2YHS4_9BURK|nr:extracellular solute-binding protein [Roseateles oligotrophus]MCV2369615.1 extracellular solute-binding protein [Roseateles oligotrophus]
MLTLTMLAACGAKTETQEAKTEITLMRFFGSCDAKYGAVNDAALGLGECGIITTLVNQFNATNTDGIHVRTQVAEWGPYYDQLTARLVAKDVPTVAVMHESALGDYVRRGLLLPLDAEFKAAGIDTADFTDHARRGVGFDGPAGSDSYALPFDTWAWLWHINTRLMGQAQLLGADGQPMLPRSPEELLAHARQFRAKTGKPYFAWAVVNETAANNRTFLTLLAQQNARLFATNGKSVDMHQPAVTKALSLMQQLYAEGHIKPNLDYAGANQAFLNGEAGVSVVGTWTIDQYLRESRNAGSPFEGGYAVRPFAQLFERKAVFADGHAWAMFKAGSADEKTRAAGVKLLKFIWEHSAEWSRTGHLPVRRSVAGSEAFRALPLRAELAEITETGVGMPGNVPTQRAIELLIGEDIANLMVSGKPIAEVQASIEKRVNKALQKARR